jgi:hypothetical protein
MDDRFPDAFPGYQVHVIYAIPADGSDRFLERATGIARDLAAVDGWWQAQVSDRTPRFDLASFASCGSEFGNLDLSFVRLAQPGATYASAEGAAFRQLRTDVAQRGFGRLSKKYLVYYDGPVTRPNLCGTSDVQPNSTGYAFVFTSSSESCGTVGGGDWMAITAAHELLHNLGAVFADAPHHCDLGHVCDSGSDILRGQSIAQGFRVLVEAQLDVGRDDYYGHSGEWFDVQDSPWLRNPQLPLVPLVVRAEPGGTVTTQDFEIECPPVCTTTWEQGTKLTLIPVPDDGARFIAWVGPCAAAGYQECEVTVNAATTVMARFAKALELHVRVPTGGGKVILQPGDEQQTCDDDCVLDLPAGTPSDVVATPDKGWRFLGWSGACRSSAPKCTFSLDASGTLIARFVRLTAQLSVRVAGSGRVVSRPAGISCPRVCRHAFPQGTTVRLVAAPSPGWKFSRWSGRCATRKVCNAAIPTTRALQATFVRA